MIQSFTRATCLCAGLAGGATLSQYPEFAQQYTQRLAGQVDALGVVVADFDASAARASLTRDEALAQLDGTAFLTARRADMTRTIDRHARLSAALAALRTASPLQKIAMPHRLADRQLLQDTWGDFAPAVPLTTAGAASGGIGFIGAWTLLAGLLAMLRLPFRRKPVYARIDPPLTRPRTTPHLMGETRP